MEKMGRDFGCSRGSLRASQRTRSRDCLGRNSRGLAHVWEAGPGATGRAAKLGNCLLSKQLHVDGTEGSGSGYSGGKSVLGGKTSRKLLLLPKRGQGSRIQESHWDFSPVVPKLGWMIFQFKGFSDHSLPHPAFFLVPFTFLGRNSCLETPNLSQTGCSLLFYCLQFPNQLFRPSFVPKIPELAAPPFSLPLIPKTASPRFSCHNS